VGLGQHRSTSLLHDLVLGQVGRLGCVVGIQYAAAGSGGVLSNVLQVADGRLEAVLHCTQLGTLAVDLLHGTVQNLNGLLRAVSGGDVQVGYAGFLNNCFMLNSIGGGDAQGIQTGAGRAVSNSEVILGEQPQLTCVVGGSHTGAGSIDRTDDRLHVAALGQLHFGAVQGDRSVGIQLGGGGGSLQTQLTQQTAARSRAMASFASGPVRVIEVAAASLAVVVPAFRPSPPGGPLLPLASASLIGAPLEDPRVIRPPATVPVTAPSVAVLIAARMASTSSVAATVTVSPLTVKSPATPSTEAPVIGPSLVVPPVPGSAGT